MVARVVGLVLLLLEALATREFRRQMTCRGSVRTVSWPDAKPTYSWYTEVTTSGTRLLSVPICPDLLDFEALGVADNWRGRVVRAFFWLMRWWPM
jgi:hypothetical protein